MSGPAKGKLPPPVGDNGIAEEPSREALLAELASLRTRLAETTQVRHQMQALLDTVPDYVYFKDRARRFVVASRQFCKLFQRDLDDIIGRRDEDLFPPEIAANTIADDRRVIATGEPLIGRIEGSDELGWVSTSKLPWRGRAGNILGLLGISRDISALRAVERRLRESEQRFRAFYESAFEGVAISEKGVIVDVNDRAVELLGYTRQELIGMPVRDVVAPEDRELVAQNIRSGYDEPYEHRILRKDGTRLEIEVCGRMIQYRGKSCRFTTLHDVTARNRAERERQRLEDQLLQAQKLESLGVLAGGIAHDFNNLLMGMMGNAELALVHLPRHTDGRNFVSEILKAVRRASDLTRQMLAYSGRSQLVVEDLDLNALIGDLHSLLLSAIPRKISFSLSLAPELPYITGDSTQLGQIVLNLVTNAAEAIGDGFGSVSVHTGEASPAEHPPELAQPERKHVLLEVTDDGCGMDEDTRSRVFEPFFTTKFTGRGLGLSAVRGIVRSHGGAVHIESAPGEGTRFRLWFPAADVTRPALPRPRDSDRSWRGSGLVLLVDDEPGVRQVAARALRWMGFVVETARNGVDALECFRARSDIRCVLLDMHMPAMGGVEAFEKMHSLRPEVPVVLSSGYSEQEAGPLRERGLAGFIQKPYELAALRHTLRAVLEGGDTP